MKRVEPSFASDPADRLGAFDDDDLVALRDDPALGRITAFAARLCETPIAVVSLVGDAQQEFVARVGLDLVSTSRDVSFCTHSMIANGYIEVPDATRDARFVDNPLVTGHPHIRFYAAMPVRSEDGVALGTLCVMAHDPRDGLSALQREGLAVLAEQVSLALQANRRIRLQHRASAAAADDSERRFMGLADAVPQMVWSTKANGDPDYFNKRWYEFTGLEVGESNGDAWSNVLHPDDRERAIAVWQGAVATGEKYEIEYRLRHHDGSYRWALGNGLPQRDASGRITRWFGTCTDIHEQRLALEEREVISQELSHRIKNIFAVILGLIGVMARDKPTLAPLTDELRERIAALGRAHDYVRPHSPKSHPGRPENSLHGLMETLFAPYQDLAARRFTITGPDVTIDDRAVTPLALFFHELATNAIKYGALSTDSGSIAITITRGDNESVELGWQERGGPAVMGPGGASGFGSRLIELSVVRQLGGSYRREWLADGLRVSASFPPASLRR